MIYDNQRQRQLQARASWERDGGLSNRESAILAIATGVYLITVCVLDNLAAFGANITILYVAAIIPGYFMSDRRHATAITVSAAVLLFMKPLILEPSPFGWAAILNRTLALMAIGFASWLARMIRVTHARLTDKVRQTRQIAREALLASRAKSTFLANMSHDLRTSVNGILGFSRLLLEEDLTGAQAEYARTIHASAEEQLRIVNGILDLSKVESGKLELEESRFRLPELVENVAHLFAAEAHSKGLKIHSSVAPELPAEFIGDPLRLRQVLTNLVCNAVKFTERGEVLIRADGNLQDDRSATLRFQVLDTGIGIPLEQQAKIFDGFVQGDNSLTSLRGGTGLGLAISKNLVGLMGGEIRVESVPGGGSTFTFTAKLSVPDSDEGLLAHRTFPDPNVPVFEPQASAPSDLAAGPSSERRNEITGVRRVLVVEDNAVSQLLMKKLLLRTGCSVDIAATGFQALDLLGHEYYDAIFMDVQMPKMDGCETTRRIRQIPALSDVPVIAMTAHAMKGDREKCLACGMNDYLSKPIHAAELYDILGRWLTKRRSAE